jgi:hypothetical protein
MVLQTKFKDGYEVNTDLGDEYHFIGKFITPDKFMECCKECFGDNIKDYLDQCYAFIVNRKGANTIPLYSSHENCVLNDAGGLFKNLTYR